MVSVFKRRLIIIIAIAFAYGGFAAALIYRWKMNQL